MIRPPRATAERAPLIKRCDSDVIYLLWLHSCSTAPPRRASKREMNVRGKAYGVHSCALMREQERMNRDKVQVAMKLNHLHGSWTFCCDDGLEALLLPFFVCRGARSRCGSWTGTAPIGAGHQRDRSRLRSRGRGRGHRHRHRRRVRVCRVPGAVHFRDLALDETQQGFWVFLDRSFARGARKRHEVSTKTRVSKFEVRSSLFEVQSSKLARCKDEMWLGFLNATGRTGLQIRKLGSPRYYKIVTPSVA
ncbi:hypothetical protein F5Y12DRAFT_599873 [Xylaria sp. FL1777]|nr:hypothetical protein F5Y12DRAFT_599873 [Xylaria sp. FL1777]